MTGTWILLVLLAVVVLPLAILSIIVDREYGAQDRDTQETRPSKPRP
jgi:ABC-type cobalt transport system substrate-binding protein